MHVDVWSKSQVRKSQKQLFSTHDLFYPPHPQLSGYASQFQDDSLTTSFQELNQSADDEELDRRKQERGKGMGHTTGTKAKWWLLFLFSNISLTALEWNENNLWFSRKSRSKFHPFFRGVFSDALHSVESIFGEDLTTMEKNSFRIKSIMKEKYKIQNWKCFMLRWSPV